MPKLSSGAPKSPAKSRNASYWAQVVSKTVTPIQTDRPKPVQVIKKEPEMIEFEFDILRDSSGKIAKVRARQVK